MLHIDCVISSLRFLSIGRIVQADATLDLRTFFVIRWYGVELEELELEVEGTQYENSELRVRVLEEICSEISPF